MALEQMTHGKPTTSYQARSTRRWRLPTGHAMHEGATNPLLHK